MYLGSWKIDDYLTFCCNTHDPDTGVGTDGDSVPTYRVYEDETGTPILTGSMAKLDDANTVGFYSEQIQLTAGNGFEKGKCYTIYISATVDSDTGTMHHIFQVEAEVDVNTISATVNVTQIEGSDATDQINDACDTALSDYDAPTKAELDSGLAGLNDPTASAIAEAVRDLVIEGTETLRGVLRILLSKVSGLADGGGTDTISYRDVADTMDRIVLTVDEHGNRSASSIDGS